MRLKLCFYQVKNERLELAASYWGTQGFIKLTVFYEQVLLTQTKRPIHKLNSKTFMSSPQLIFVMSSKAKSSPLRSTCGLSPCVINRNIFLGWILPFILLCGIPLDSTSTQSIYAPVCLAIYLVQVVIQLNELSVSQVLQSTNRLQPDYQTLTSWVHSRSPLWRSCVMH